MKPERIQFAPWFSEWTASVPSASKAFACDSTGEAMHYVAHVHRVARFYPDSEVKTTVSEDHFVNVRILPADGKALTKAQFTLGQRIDEALAFLQPPVAEDVVS